MIKTKSLYITLLCLVSFSLNGCSSLFVSIFGAGVIASAISYNINSNSNINESNFVNDPILSKKINEQLNQSNATKGIYNINFKGIVLLIGTVPNNNEKQKISNKIKTLDGVINVIDKHLTLSSEFKNASLNDTYSLVKVKSALIANASLDTKNLIFEVYNGDLYIIGTVKSDKERNYIVDLNKNISGIRNIISYIFLENEFNLIVKDQNIKTNRN